MAIRTWDEIYTEASAFSKRWIAAHNEEAEGQVFVLELMKVFGMNDPAVEGAYEYRVNGIDATRGYIDYLVKGKIAIEMKSKGHGGKNLEDALSQLQDYMIQLPAEEVPDLLMVCDFQTFRLIRRSAGLEITFKLKDLRKHVKWFSDVAGYTSERVREEQLEVNVRAAEKMAKLHDALKACGYDGHELEVYLVRLLFCLFADDTEIFPKDSFIDYLENSKEDGSDLADRIARLFEVLNMPSDVRDKRTHLSEELKKFRYINGRLFETRLMHADFDAKMRSLLLDCANSNWSGISPAIFGSMFQGVMDKNERRALGAHYTSEENILKLINPLFLDEVWSEFNRVKTDPLALNEFHDKISRLKFLDPACGCGNFLIVAYRELRMLELEIIKMKASSQTVLSMEIAGLLKVGVEQFYGIEIEDFPCQIAQVGMWLMDHQMNLVASEILGSHYVRLPLTRSATIVHGNALRMDWEEVVPKSELSYIMGNPPFVGARIMNPEQKSEVLSVFQDTKNAGNLDYVTAWYKKAAEMISHTIIRAAFVSSNSISQGEQVALLWEPLFMKCGIRIDFAYKTFKWSNEAKGKAAVHCVIVGFSCDHRNRRLVIFDEHGIEQAAENINGYLIDAPTIFVHSSSHPLCAVPEIGIGNKPIDGGNYLFTKDEMAEFIAIEPAAEAYFKPWIGSHEFINGYYRYCLWLGDCSPSALRSMPHALKRVEMVRTFRLSSSSKPTQKLADTPTRFHVENMPTGPHVVIPKVSSERRHYMPIGFVEPDILASDLLFIIPDATLYHFGVLTSSVHMAWTRTVCGRLEMRYRYSKDIVYNNFPWPNATEEQMNAIRNAAENVLLAREAFPDSSLADLYDPNTMPPLLLRAHQNLDRWVLRAYGFPMQISEAEIVAKLFAMYQALVEAK